MSSKEVILENIANLAKLNEGSEGVLRVLHALFRKGPISTKELARETYLPIPVAVAVRNELQKQGIVMKTSSGTVLTAKGEKIATDFGFRSRVEARCSTCEGIGILLPNELEEQFQLFKEICKKRPPPRTELDQARTTPFTAFARALQMQEHGNLDGKRICFLGDGDLVSLAVSMLGNPEEVCVFELDERLSDFISTTAQDQDIMIDVLLQDLRIPLPIAQKSRFDVFSTDPPYSLQGSLLFLLRGLQLLKKISNRAGYLSMRLPDFESLQTMQTFLVSSGCILREIRRNFNHYEGAEILGNRSDLYLIETGPNFHAIRLSEAIFDQNSSIYTGIIRPTTRIYKCVDCGALYQVGMSQLYQSIEALKNAGCATLACKSSTFRLLERHKTP
ncbi:MAG: bis-aminopropyl spermidine synthase family protein [Candidatus Hodarchaeota archaeon]